MKLVLFILAALMFNAPYTEKWVIERGSNLCIEGRSNINNFRCDIKEYLQPDTIYVTKDRQGMKPFPVNGGLTIDIKRFDCHQKHITNDLRKTLKADEQPQLKIRLLDIGYYNGNANNIRGWVSIELAGITKKTVVDYQVKHDQPDLLLLNGSRQLKFSDFGLQPPQKLAGLIKVEEELTVKFQLVLRALKADTNRLVPKND